MGDYHRVIKGDTKSLGHSSEKGISQIRGRFKGL